MVGSPGAIARPEGGRGTVELAIRLGVVALLIYWCVSILRPFIIPLVWGITLAVALHPLFVRLERAVGGRRKLAAVLLVTATLAAILVPTVWLSGSLMEGARSLTDGIESGRITIPPAPAQVAEWPIVGAPLHETWNLASTNLEALLQQYEAEVKALGLRLVATARQGLLAALLTAVALVIAVVLLVRRESAVSAALRVGAALGGARGEEFVGLAGVTIGAVAKGVVGVAAIQALLAAIGLVLADVPGAGLWALLVMILAVAQLPPILVLGPAVLYVISQGESTLTMALFTVWSVVVSLSDAVLKPLLMGRGTPVPVAVILIGAIGGLILHGLIGLFVGAVVFSIGYRLFVDWSTPDTAERDQAISA